MAEVGKKPKSIEASLWDSANRLRGSVESSEYKHVVLSLIFLKFVSDKFEERRAELAARASASPGSHTVAEAGVRSRCAKRWPLIGGARWPWIQSWWKVWSCAREDARRSRPRRSRSFSWTALPALCPLSSTLNGSQCSARLPPAAFCHVPRAVGARRRDREFRPQIGEGGLTSRNPPRLARQHQLLPAEGVHREGLASI